MFTGIIATKGKVTRIIKNQKECRFILCPETMFSNLIKGESIAVNGTCLTVEEFTSTTFTAFASATTLNLTNLSLLKENSFVNLERAMALGDRIGGHLVAGHVDCCIKLLNIEEDFSSKKCTFELPNNMRSLIIPKGSVTVDGISLTVTSCNSSTFSVNIIPETWAQTIASLWHIGSSINFESDMLGKYVQAHLLYPLPHHNQNSAITSDFLRENGFL